MRAIQLETGQRFGRLSIVREGPRTAAGKRSWVCRCECGNEVTIQQSNLTTGNTTSCGCYRVETTVERVRTHGQSQSPEYHAWVNMRARCFNPKSGFYPSYGGRGITVCDRWRDSFETFLADVGPRPSGDHSLDRIDVDGDYEPGNVRWATKEGQAQNKRDNRRVTVKGETKTVAEWARELGVSPKRIYTRLARGWDEEAAVTTPFVAHADRKMNKAVIFSDLG